jgi:hypothetical protein
MWVVVCTGVHTPAWRAHDCKHKQLLAHEHVLEHLGELAARRSFLSIILNLLEFLRAKTPHHGRPTMLGPVRWRHGGTRCCVVGSGACVLPMVVGLPSPQLVHRWRQSCHPLPI